MSKGEIEPQNRSGGSEGYAHVFTVDSVGLVVNTDLAMRYGIHEHTGVQNVFIRRKAAVPVTIELEGEDGSRNFVSSTPRSRRGYATFFLETERKDGSSVVGFKVGPKYRFDVQERDTEQIKLRMTTMQPSLVSPIKDPSLSLGGAMREVELRLKPRR